MGDWLDRGHRSGLRLAYGGHGQQRRIRIRHTDSGTLPPFNLAVQTGHRRCLSAALVGWRSGGLGAHPQPCRKTAIPRFTCITATAALPTVPEDSAGVWVDYAGVWHLSENGNGTAGEFKDSAQYGNHGQGGEGTSEFVPSQLNGMIANGQDFVIMSDFKWDDDN